MGEIDSAHVLSSPPMRNFSISQSLTQTNILTIPPTHAYMSNLILITTAMFCFVCFLLFLLFFGGLVGRSGGGGSGPDFQLTVLCLLLSPSTTFCSVDASSLLMFHFCVPLQYILPFWFLSLTHSALFVPILLTFAF